MFFGDKSAKDIKQIQPIIDKALSYGEEFKNLTNDQLRAKTQEFRDRVAAAVAEKEARIRELEAEAEAENLKGVAAATVEATDGQQEQHDDSQHDDEKARLEKIEKLLDEADRLKDDVYKITEDVLKEILPEAFAVVKETARRFVENPTLSPDISTLGRVAKSSLSQCRDIRRQGSLAQYVGCRRKARNVGHGALRCPAYRRRGAAPGENSRDGYR